MAQLELDLLDIASLLLSGFKSSFSFPPDAPVPLFTIDFGDFKPQIIANQKLRYDYFPTADIVSHKFVLMCLFVFTIY